MVENTPPAHWPLAIVVSAMPNKDDGLVRTVKIRTADKKVVERDIRKISLLEAF